MREFELDWLEQRMEKLALKESKRFLRGQFAPIRFRRRQEVNMCLSCGELYGGGLDEKEHCSCLKTEKERDEATRAWANKVVHLRTDTLKKPNETAKKTYLTQRSGWILETLEDDVLVVGSVSYIFYLSFRGDKEKFEKEMSDDNDLDDYSKNIDILSYYDLEMEAEVQGLSFVRYGEYPVNYIRKNIAKSGSSVMYRTMSQEGMLYSRKIPNKQKFIIKKLDEDTKVVKYTGIDELLKIENITNKKEDIQPSTYLTIVGAKKETDFVEKVIKGGFINIFWLLEEPIRHCVNTGKNIVETLESRIQSNVEYSGALSFLENSNLNGSSLQEILGVSKGYLDPLRKLPIEAYEDFLKIGAKMKGYSGALLLEKINEVVEEQVRSREAVVGRYARESFFLSIVGRLADLFSSGAGKEFKNREIEQYLEYMSSIYYEQGIEPVGAMSVYNDYMAMLGQLIKTKNTKSISNEVALKNNLSKIIKRYTLFPSSLKKAHDLMLKDFRAYGNIVTNINIELESESYKHYEIENEEYVLKIPKTAKELIEEGEALRHCVGSYVNRVAKGRTRILFMRNKKRVDKPFATIEVSRYGKIVQFRGEANSRVTDPKAIELKKQLSKIALGEE